MSNANRQSPNIYRIPTIMDNIEEFRQRWEHGPIAASDELLVSQCTKLFSSDYGIWSDISPRRPGESIAISHSMFRELLKGEESWIALTYSGPNLIGYCIVERVNIPKKGTVHWVTQLVVAKAYRKMRVSIRLLYSIWQFSDCYAWGLATANPLAIRALESATRRRCQKSYIVLHGDELVEYLSKQVSYMPRELYRNNGQITPTVDTKFFIDHTDIGNLKKYAARAKRPWDLGPVPDEGKEWFACIFREQDIVDVDKGRLENLFETSDDSWIEAYGRMSLDENHLWARNSDSEVKFILSRARSSENVLDAGCGMGRHSALMAKEAIRVTGVDIVPRLIEKAKATYKLDNLDFEVGDLRVKKPNGRYDIVTALYDVLGSSARLEDDVALLDNLKSVLSDDGDLFVSVMNATPMLQDNTGLKIATSESELARELEILEPSNTMEKTGNVFNPRLCLYHEGVFFRKEQFFRPGESLPSEIVVRDRRFTKSSIAELMGRVGLEVVSIDAVQSGHWDIPLDDTSVRAKELLVHARKSDA